jgi:hypothetical protein
MRPDQGVNMSLIVDRPWPVDHEYRGISAKIDFKWGHPDDPIPKGLRVSVQDPDNVVLMLRETAKYTSFDEAVRRGQQMADVQIDLLLRDKGSEQTSL